MIILLYMSVALLVMSFVVSTINGSDAQPSPTGYGVATGLGIAGVVLLIAHGISSVPENLKKKNDNSPVIKTVGYNRG